MFNITSDEAAWLIKSTIKTSYELGQAVDLVKITPSDVEQKIRQYRAINSSYDVLNSNAKEVNSGVRDSADLMEGVLKAQTEQIKNMKTESLIGKKVVGADLLYTKDGQLHIGIAFEGSSTLIVVADDVQQCEIHTANQNQRGMEVFDFLKTH